MLAAAAAAADPGNKRVPASLTVLVGRPGDDASVVSVRRPDMVPAKLEEMFGGTVEFLTEKATGVLVWPARWLYECLPPPATYLVQMEVNVERAPDILERMEYRGETLVVIRNVPDAVSEAHLNIWFKRGLEDEQLDIVHARASLDELTRKLAAIDRAIAGLPTEVSDRVETPEQELLTRKRRAEFLQRLREDTATDKAAMAAKLHGLQTRFESLRVYTLKKATTEPPFSLCTWEVHFDESSDGQERAYIACHKKDWNRYWLLINMEGGGELDAAHTAGDEEGGAVAAAAAASIARAGRGPMPAPGAQDEVRMEAVVVERVRHGAGMYKFDDADERARGLYSGQWCRGECHGIGTQVSAQGRFQGHHDMGVKAGKGTLVTVRGDVYRGDWAFVPRGARSEPSFIDGLEYADGRPDGQGRWDYSDGSSYSGAVAAGVPCGPGRYTLPSGDMLEGAFDARGALQGEGSASVDGVTLLGGGWQRGLLGGFGTEIDVTAGTYEGDFDGSLKHGYGSTAFRLVRGGHVGSYICGDRGGHGMADFSPLTPAQRQEQDTGAFDAAAAKAAAAGSSAKSKAKLLASLPDQGEVRAEGRWRGHLLRSGGIFTARHGQPGDPLAATFGLATDSAACARVPHLPALLQAEDAVMRDRQARARAVAHSMRAQRRAKEAANAAKFARFSRAADAALVAFAEANKTNRDFLRRIAARLEERALVHAAERAAVLAGHGEHGHGGERGHGEHGHGEHSHGEHSHAVHGHGEHGHGHGAHHHGHGAPDGNHSGHDVSSGHGPAEGGANAATLPRHA